MGGEQRTAAIYVSESGGDSRVLGPYSGSFDIIDNIFTNNWEGVSLWENPNRFCSDGSDTAGCTLVDPSVYTIASCAANLATATPRGNPDYFDGCRWKTQNVKVADNTFNFTPSNIGADCTTAKDCGINSLFSNYGTSPPYQGWVVPNNISNNQNNVFTDNVYNGPWKFRAFADGVILTPAQWMAGITNIERGYNFGAQDAGSIFTSTTTTSLPATTLSSTSS